MEEMIFLWFKPIRSNTLKYGRITFLLNESNVLWHVSLGLHYGGGSGGGGGGLTISYRHQKFWALCPWCITVRYKTPVLQTMTRSKIIWDNLWSLYSLKTFMFSWTSLVSQPMCKIKCSLWKVICDNISIWNDYCECCPQIYVSLKLWIF